jgi:imidazolonepropionase-like amidohydrolase
MTRRVGVVLLICFAVLPATLRSQSAKVALVGGTVYTVAAPPIQNGVVLINGRTIEAVGPNLTVPPEYRRVNVAGQSVFPGLVNASTTLGLVEYGGLVPSTVDTDETTDPVTPQLRVTEALQLDSRNIPVVRKYGVTVALVMPGEHNVFAGQSAVISLGGGSLSDVVIQSPIGMHLNLGEPPRATYGGRNKMPSTRMGIAALIRQTLIDARQYADKRRRDPTTPTDVRLESLVPVVGGEMTAFIRAQRMDDILTALRLADEFKLKMVLTDGVDAYKVADQLARRQIPVVLGPVTTQPSGIETAGAVYENAALLAKAGVRFALTTGGAQQAGQLPFEAGIAAAYGLDRTRALEAITLTAAQILGIADRYGSLERGKVADVVVAEGLILQPRAKVTHVFIGGRQVDLKTWQEELYEKYAPRPKTTSSSALLRPM